MSSKAENFIRKNFSHVPSSAGLYCFYDKKQNPLFVGATKNLKDEINRILESEIDRTAIKSGSRQKNQKHYL